MLVPLAEPMVPVPPSVVWVPDGSTNVTPSGTTLTTVNCSPLMVSTSPEATSTSHVPSTQACRFVPSAATSGTGTVVVVVGVVVVGAVVVVVVMVVAVAVVLDGVAVGDSSEPHPATATAENTTAATRIVVRMDAQWHRPSGTGPTVTPPTVAGTRTGLTPASDDELTTQGRPLHSIRTDVARPTPDGTVRWSV
jgi:hypothetical protein